MLVDEALDGGQHQGCGLGQRLGLLHGHLDLLAHGRDFAGQADVVGALRADRAAQQHQVHGHLVRNARGQAGDHAAGDAQLGLGV
ncbi:hypothetical protein D3C79_1051900 [compost metagenome]